MRRLRVALANRLPAVFSGRPLRQRSLSRGVHSAKVAPGDPRSLLSVCGTRLPLNRLRIRFAVA